MFNLKTNKMSKKVAVIAPDPVNGMGLFQYLEAFFENKIQYKTFAISDKKEIKTNSGIIIVLDDVIANLKGHEKEYDALVFSCGDAMIPGSKINEKAMADAVGIIAEFNKENKLLIGHCAAAVIFDNAGVTNGKKVAVHPYGKAAVKNGVATDDKFNVDKNIFTAQCENSIWQLMPELLNALK